VSCIVAAHNEAPRIARVLSVLLSFKGFDEVIVVDDGSTDDTAGVAQRLGARVLRLGKNAGKGRAMDTGVRAARGNVLFFCDADVRGLSHRIICMILERVLSGDLDMVIGMRNRKVYFLRFIFFFIPLLGGERALTRDLWEKISARYKDGFRIETALNYFSEHFGKGYDFKVFPGLTQTIKEKKLGLVKGFMARVQMYGEVTEAWWELHVPVLSEGDERDTSPA